MYKYKYYIIYFIMIIIIYIHIYYSYFNLYQLYQNKYVYLERWLHHTIFDNFYSQLKGKYFAPKYFAYITIQTRFSRVSPMQNSINQSRATYATITFHKFRNSRMDLPASTWDAFSTHSSLGSFLVVNWNL